MTDANTPWTYVVPGTVIVSLLALDFNSVVRYVEGEHKLPVCQEKRHEVVLLGIRDIKDEAVGRLGFQGQGEVAPGSGTQRQTRMSRLEGEATSRSSWTCCTSQRESLGRPCSAACCWQCCRSGRTGKLLWDSRRGNRALAAPGEGSTYLWLPVRALDEQFNPSFWLQAGSTHWTFTFCDWLFLALELLSVCLDSSAAGGRSTGQSSKDVWTFSVYFWKSSASMSRSCLQIH